MNSYICHRCNKVCKSKGGLTNHYRACIGIDNKQKIIKDNNPWFKCRACSLHASFNRSRTERCTISGCYNFGRRAII